MSDVFISYARQEEAEARRIAEALRGLGHAVWRDDELPAHRDYSEVIEERLRAAKAVVVVWSAEAAKSQWVRAEADLAREAGTLVQISLDGAPLPMPFNRIQCADLTGWTGSLDNPGWKKVAASVAELLGVVSEPLAAPAGSDIRSPHPLAAKPSIAVIPFANLSADPEQSYFADGMVDEIVARRARFKTLQVIAAGGSIVHDGRVASPQEAARRLGVNYLLEGSVRRAGGRVRIGLHLVDAASGAEIWTDRLEDELADIFALQDRVAQRVAGGVIGKVQDADAQKAARRPTANPNSYDLYLRSVALFRLSRKAEMLEAIRLLDQAIALDPAYALALSQSAVCHRQVVDHHWCDDRESVRRQGLALAEQALAMAGDDAICMAQVAASLPGLERNLDRALALTDRAISLNPDSAFVWLISGSVHLRAGQPEIAAEHLETAMGLDPISSFNGFMRMYLASARFQQRRFDEALDLFNTTTLRLPVSYAVLAALHGHRGETAQAQRALSSLREVCEAEVEEIAATWFPQPEYRELLLSGIAVAVAGARP